MSPTAQLKQDSLDEAYKASIARLFDVLWDSTSTAASDEKRQEAIELFKLGHTTVMNAYRIAADEMFPSPPKGVSDEKVSNASPRVAGAFKRGSGA